MHPIYSLLTPGAGRFLLVGEAPNARMGVDHAGTLLPSLDWKTGRAHTANRLMRFTGWPDLRTFHRTFDRTNLLGECPGTQGNGRAFPLGLARAASVELFNAVERRDYLGLVVLGKRAAGAFRWWEAEGEDRVPYAELNYLEWFEASPYPPRTGYCPKRAAIVPHTSALNRWWHDEGNRANARAFFDALTRQAGL